MLNAYFQHRNIQNLGWVAIVGVWLFCALTLHPKRKWSWWACLAPLVVSFLIGIAFVGELALMFIHPDQFEPDNRYGALLVAGIIYFLTFSSILLAHLFFIRRQFFTPSLP
ncbi:MAG: hypothetical protein QM627_02610 [Luteolibacter sp.]